MAGQEWLMLMAMVFMLAGTLFIIFEIIPSLAVDRFVIRMSDLRDRIADERDQTLSTDDREALDRLDQAVARIALSGLPPIRFLVAAFLVSRTREQILGSAQGGEPEHAREHRAHDRRIDELEVLFVREMARGTILTSRTWVLSWPVWALLLRRKLSPAAIADRTVRIERTAAPVAPEAGLSRSDDAYDDLLRYEWLFWKADEMRSHELTPA